MLWLSHSHYWNVLFFSSLLLTFSPSLFRCRSFSLSLMTEIVIVYTEMLPLYLPKMLEPIHGLFYCCFCRWTKYCTVVCVSRLFKKKKLAEQRFEHSRIVNWQLCCRCARYNCIDYSHEWDGFFNFTMNRMRVCVNFEQSYKLNKIPCLSLFRSLSFSLLIS